MSDVISAFVGLVLLFPWGLVSQNGVRGVSKVVLLPTSAEIISMTFTQIEQTMALAFA
jgi:hypothetical protein